MPFLPSYGTVINKPIGVTGKSTDARSQFYDPSAFAFRDYASTAEVLAYLTGANPTETAAFRAGHFPIFVTASGTTTVYYFKDGVTDGNLVPMNTGGSATTDASQLTAGILPTPRIGDGSIAPVKLSGLTTNSSVVSNTTVAAWGDSLTYGSGGYTTVQYPGGTPWMEYFKASTGFNFANFGVPGENSTQVRTRLLADTGKLSWPVVIWVGTNNLGSNSTILADIAAMVAALGHTKYLIVNLPGHSSSAFWSGTGNYTTLQALNASIASTYGVRAVDIRSALVAAYDSNDTQDSTDHSHDIPPTSVMAPGDPVHFNDKGYKIIAAAISAKASYLFPTADQSIVSTAGINALFNSPLGIGNATPNTGKFTAIAVGTNSVIPTDASLAGDGTSTRVVGEIRGAVRILHPNPSTNAGGIVIKPRYADISGYAALEIAGTGPSWVSGKGFVFSNNDTSVAYGGSLLVSGNMQINGQTNAGTIVATGALKAAAITNVPDGSSFERAVHFIKGTGGLAGGMIVTRLSSAELDAIGIFNRRPGEMAHNDNLNRLVMAIPDSSITNAFKFAPIALQEDIPNIQFFNGAGINVTRNGNDITVASALIAPVAQITSGTFSENGSSNWNGNGVTNGVAKAFDNDLNTSYQSSPNDINNANYVARDFASKYILTKVELVCETGYDYIGAKIQGSNDNSTWTDLFTISTITTTSNFVNVLAISSVTPYRYARYIQNPANYIVAIKELRFFGYQSSEISVAPGSVLTLNSSTKVLDVPVATNSVSGYLSAADRTTFAGKQNAITLTTVGSSGPSTFDGTNLNIPNYAGGGGGGGGDAFLAGSQTFAGVNTFANSSGYYPVTISGSAAATYLKINNTNATPNPGIEFQQASVASWSIGNVGPILQFYNAVLGSPALTFTTSNNLTTFNGPVAFNNSVGNIVTVDIQHNYSGKSIYYNSGNTQIRTSINDGGTGIISGFNGSGTGSYSLDSTSGNITSLLGDVEVSAVGKGFIVKDSSGVRWRIIVTPTTGALSTQLA